MAEAGFAKTYLTMLDSRPAKLSPDHVEDARKFPARPPYILPRMPTEMSKPKSSASSAPGQERSVTVTLRSPRNPPLDIKLAAQPLSTSVFDVKAAVSQRARIPADKIKILHNKRPLPDSKVLSDVLGGDAAGPTVEFAVMVMGGAASVLPEAGADAAETTPGGKPKGAAVVETPQFWADLNGFLMQRVKDEDTAEELSTLFKSAWESRQAKP